eukprot:3603760-Rhodomonas_salina.1
MAEVAKWWPEDDTQNSIDSTSIENHQDDKDQVCGCTPVPKTVPGVLHTGTKDGKCTGRCEITREEFDLGKST